MSDGAAGNEPPNVVRPDGEQGSATPGMGTLGVWVFLASLSMLFVSGILGFLVIRFSQDEWPPPGAPGLPPLLILSTLLAFGCSATMQMALNGIKKGNGLVLVQYLGLTLALAVLFVIVQTIAWFQFYDAEVFSEHLYGFTFYMLTGLHAAHVIGGMIALVWVLVRAVKGHYNWAHFPGVRHCALYWHFLDVVWVVLYVVLLIAS